MKGGVITQLSQETRLDSVVMIRYDHEEAICSVRCLIKEVNENEI